FRPWITICLRSLSRRLAKARSHRLHGPARQSLRQRQGRELHEDTQGRSRVSDGIRNLRGRYSRPSPLHRRGLQHSQTPLRARLSEPGAIRGAPRPATCQNRRLKLSTIKDALHPSGVFKHLGDRLEFQGDSIHAVALPSRLGPVVEHVAEMSAAAPAMHFRSWNEQAVIVGGADSVLDRREKARPASAAIEFGFGAKERQIAGRTSEQTGSMLVIERAGKL